MYQCGPLSHISSDLGTHVTDYNAQRWAERYLPQGNSIVENQNGQLKYRFFKIRGYKCIKGWVKCVLTINKNGAKGMSPLDIRVFSSGSGEKEVEEDVWITMQFYVFFFLPSSPQLLPRPAPPLHDTVVSGPGLKLQMLEAEMILRPETITIFLNLFVEKSQGPDKVSYAFTPPGKIGVNMEWCNVAYWSVKFLLCSKRKFYIYQINIL